MVIAYENDQPISCGAIKDYAPGMMGFKRMCTFPESRGKGIATKVLNELEIWVNELGGEKCVLETGKR